MFTKLASLPAARGGQVPASGRTARVDINGDTPTLIDLASESRANITFENLSDVPLRYFYQETDYDHGFTIFNDCGAQIDVREKVYVQLEEAGTVGVLCYDRAEG